MVTFTTPDWSYTGKLIYAYATYSLLILVYTANNIPYGALMAVMTGDDKERTTLGSFRMVGAFAGGMLVQGALLFLVAYYGNVDPSVKVSELGPEKYGVTVSAPRDVPNVNIKTEDGVALFTWDDASIPPDENTPTHGKSFSLEADRNYAFIVEGEPDLNADKLSIIDQKEGYSKAMYLMSVFLTVFMLITFFTTRERVHPPKSQKNNLKIIP